MTLLEILKEAGYNVPVAKSSDPHAEERYKLLQEFAKFPLELQRQMLEYGRKWLQAMSR